MIILADEGLPFTGAAWVTGNSEVGLQAHLAEEGGEYFALVESATETPLESVKSRYLAQRSTYPGFRTPLSWVSRKN